MAKALKESVLIVDDTPANLRLLTQMLTTHGYKVRPVTEGGQALVSAKATPPDLILLDIMMPNMNGYEVCEHLKADERTRDIPIIFLSALGETQDKIKAFTVGGVDYITKPFQAQEVLARVKTHIALRKLQIDLQRRVVELQAFAHTVAHDLKNPLAMCVGYAEVLLDESIELSEEDRRAYACRISQSGRKMGNIVDELLLLASIREEEVEVQPLDMMPIIEAAQARAANLVSQYQAEFILPDPADATWPLPNALGYGPWVEEVWANYLSNAIKYGGRPPRVECGATVQLDGFVRFWVHDNGEGLDQEQQRKLFAPFERLQGDGAREPKRPRGHGLGLSIVRRIVEKLGGHVGVESQPGAGSVFWFTLPSPSSSFGGQNDVE